MIPQKSITKLIILGFLCLMTAMSSNCKNKQAQVNDHKQPVMDQSGWSPIHTVFPPAICEGTPWPVPKLPVEIALRPTQPPLAYAPPGTINLARGKKITSSDPDPIIGELTLINDGEKMVGDGYYVELSSDPQWIKIDLERTSTIYALWFWHRSGQDNFVYHDVVVEVSNDPDFQKNVTQVFNNDYDDSLGKGKGKDLPYIESMYGKRIQLDGIECRYVRIHSNGNGRNEMNHYTEVEIHGLPRSNSDNDKPR